MSAARGQLLVACDVASDTQRVAVVKAAGWLPAVVVKHATPAAFKAQMARSAPVACRMP